MQSICGAEGTVGNIKMDPIVYMWPCFGRLDSKAWTVGIFLQHLESLLHPEASLELQITSSTQKDAKY